MENNKGIAMERKIKFRNYKIAITVVSFLGMLLFKSNIDWNNLANNYIDINRVKEILYDLCIGIFSALVLVWIVDDINNSIQEKKSKENEMKAIKRAHRVIQLYIEKYKKFYYCVTTPISNRSFLDITMEENFNLSDMKDMYRTSLLNTESFSSSSIESFLEAELELREKINYTVSSINFEYYSDIVSLLIKFIECSIRLESRSVILGNKNMTVGGKPYIEQIEDDLIHGDKYYSDFRDGKGKTGHFLNPYIYLAEMMKEERKLLMSYENEIENLK